MKIGLSFSRCVKDIFEEKVHYDDVLIIIARTDFDPTIEKEWDSIWDGYTGLGWNTAPEWINHLEEKELFRDLVLRLYNDGKLHQPRKFGAHPARRSEYYWLETVLPSEELEKNTAAKKAWSHFQVLAGLTNVNLDKEYK